MKDIKVAVMPKVDVQKLDKLQLQQLEDLKNHPGFGLLKVLGENAIRELVIKSAINVDIEAEEARKLLAGIGHMKGAVDFLMDAPDRAKEQLISLKEKDGSERKDKGK